MPADTYWLVEDRVLQVDLSGDVDAEMVLAAATKAAEFIDAAPDQSVVPLIHALVDAAEIASFPKTLKEFADVYKPMASHQQMGWVLLYGTDDPLIRFITNAASQMYSTRYRQFATRAEALAFLQDIDSTLPDLPG